jgi:DNA invertase Pin-like site-specific DNA recombinase
LEQTRAAVSVPDVLSERDLVLVDAVAQRVFEMLDERSAAQTAGQLVDASTLARMLGVSRSTVYEHADELGAVRLGGGSKRKFS